MRQMTGFIRGVNFGGWMSHEHYEPEHVASFITEEDFARVAQWGVDHVRVPVDYNLFEPTGDGQEGLGFRYVDLAAQWCRKYGLRMVLDLHKAAGFSYEATFGESGLFDSEAYQQKFYDLWATFARRYGSQPETIAFELLNEVTDPAFIGPWNRIASRTIEVIRAIAPDTWILVGSYWNNAVDALKDLQLPKDDKLVYNFHCYDPMGFTHQGAPWVDFMPHDFRMDYPVSKADYVARMAALPGAGSFNDARLRSVFDQEYFLGRFKDAVDMAEKLNVPLYCGEYGVIEHASDEAAVRWYKDIHAAFEHYGIGRAAWSYKKMDFGLLERPAVLPQLIENL